MSGIRYQLFHKEKKPLRNSCSIFLSQRIANFVAVAHAVSVEVGRLPEGLRGGKGGPGRLLRCIARLDMVPLSPNPGDLLLSWWFVPMTAVSSA